VNGVAAGEAIVIATRNPHKLEELQEILPGHRLLPLPDEVVLPPEDADTFTGNALGKARAAHLATGSAVIADDSGIAAAALGGRPGVRSARYAGPDATDEENLDLLLAEIAGHDDRSVAYVCAIAYISATGEETVREARCEGTLAEVPRGDGGFGYDPAFLPADVADGRTMAELDPEEKHSISHRGRAARLIAEVLGDGG
jgi:XTP/dITP diphosphohydrolase